MNLIDQHGRAFTYARLAIVDQCNLRCNYCMPENGLKWITKKDSWQTEEIEVLLRYFKNWGIQKIRFTGGEPLIRSDFQNIIAAADELNFEHMTITTNGTYIQNFQELFLKKCINKTNVSLDTMSADRFLEITKRNQWAQVWNNIEWLDENELSFRINTVLLASTSDVELKQMIEMAHSKMWDWCFIEEMPFNGQGAQPNQIWNQENFENVLVSIGIPFTKIPLQSGDTAQYYIFQNGARIGFIAAWSRTFCGTCNRLRITPEGNLHYCLYSEKPFEILNRIRTGMSENDILKDLQAFLIHKPLSGFDSEKENTKTLPSMAKIGG
jgi:cyclic pyranopterin phosphate synthase